MLYIMVLYEVKSYVMAHSLMTYAQMYIYRIM